jgi:ring-1,2-phenylacetyl-CoA epoxidase subunit PaaB
MTDTQWPRFMVFQQEKAGEPFLHNGTVHAPDAELAMLNARDVFARRPEATAMWVVPADVIFTQTREELSKAEAQAAANGAPLEFHVFAKFSEQAQCQQVGKVQAASPEAAVRVAIGQFADKKPLWWWVFPASAVTESLPGDAGSMFTAGRDRTFTDQAEYPVVTMMRELRLKSKADHKDTKSTK